MKKVKNIIFSILMMSAGYGIWNAWPTIKDTFVVVPQQTTVDMTWHRWEKDGITLMTLDHDQGLKLVKQLDAVGEKWRPEDNSEMPITLVVVNNKDTMMQLFGHETSRKEIRNGKMYIWFLWDDEKDLGL